MTSANPALAFRSVGPDEDLIELTQVIRDAYAPLGARGLRFWATHQTPEDTAKRIARGMGFVATLGPKIVATIALSRPDADSKVELLRDPQTWSFGQFAVAPQFKGRGYGRKIHDFAMLMAQSAGCRVMALHTAQPATDLIAMYQSWGYRQVGTCDWRPHTSYLSVLMAQDLNPSSTVKNAG